MRPAKKFLNLVLRKIPNNIQVFFGNWLLPARGSLFLFILLNENYLKTSKKFFSYQFRNADDLLSAVNGAHQFHEDGYIENVSESVYARTVSIIPSEPITFELTFKGIEYMRSNRKL